MLRQIAGALDGYGVRHALAGGMAMAAHGFPRATKDLDFLIAKADSERADRALRAIGFEPASEARGFVRYLRRPSAALPELTEWADLLLASRPIGLSILAQAQADPVRWEEMTLPVVAPEGLVLMKLLAHAEDPRRLTDLVDVATLLQAFPDRIDPARLREEAGRLGTDVLALCDRLTQESANSQVKESPGAYSRSRL